MQRHIPMGWLSRVPRILAGLWLAMSLAAPAAGALSGNLIVNGDFETTANLKNSSSLDNSNQAIPVHRWNNDTDYGMWIAKWGPPSLGGLAGFSTYDDPRDIAETGGTTQASGDLGNMNRSVDPTDPSGQNHVMENILFRPRWAQWFQAPENHVPGPISMDFDFYLHDWSNFDPSSPTMMIVTLYGLNFSPPHDVTYIDDNAPSHAVTPLGAEPNDAQGAWNPSGLDGDPLVHFRFNFWMQDYSDYFDQWNHISTGDAANPLWSAYDGNIITTELTETYQNYALVVYSAVYAEGNEYFWLWGGKVTDTPALLWDNFDVRLSVASAHLPGDFDGSGTVDTQDINPFILALTNPGQYQTQYGVDPVVYDTNNDDVINTEDINPFITILTGGGQSAIIPEPATFGLLAIAAAGLSVRRPAR